MFIRVLYYFPCRNHYHGIIAFTDAETESLLSKIFYGKQKYPLIQMLKHFVEHFAMQVV